jgi:Saxitoxin biosynthesis operon protein SxtJ
VEEGIRTRLTAAEGRRFGLTVGAPFVVLAALAWWRAHPTVATVLASLGGVLALAGLVVPTYLGPVERAWMSLAHAISKVTTPIVMGAMYLLVLTPIGFLRCKFGGNPLVHAEANRGYWQPRPEGSRRSASMSRQF